MGIGYRLSNGKGMKTGDKDRISVKKRSEFWALEIFSEKLVVRIWDNNNVSGNVCPIHNA